MNTRVTALQFSFCFSIIVHSAGIGTFVLWTSLRYEPATLPPQESPLTLTLVAAPDEPTPQPETPKLQPFVLRPVEPTPTIIVRPAAKLPEIPIITVPPRPPMAVQPRPLGPSPSTTVHGDASLLEPVLDVTTRQAQVEIKIQPSYLNNPEPPYPSAARRRHEQGLVLLAVKVTAEGRAAEVVIKQSSGFVPLDNAALNAVREWRFQPARIDSIPVESEIVVPVQFKLMD